MAWLHTRATSTASLPHDGAGPTILAIVWVLASIAAVVLALRVYCKFKTHRGLWWDDYILLASWACLAVYISLVSYSVVHLNYGARDWDFPSKNLVPLVKLVVVGHPFMLTSIIWSKTAFGVTLLRITDGWMKWTVWFLIITTNIVLGLSILFFYLRCRPIQASWDPTVKGVCWDDAAIKYHIFSGAYSAAADVALSLLPWKLLSGLQMRKREKIGVGIAMSMGIFAGITAIMKTYKLQDLYSGSLYDGVSVTYWSAVEAATTMIAASIPVLRVLVGHVRSSARQYHRTGEATGSRRRSLNRTATLGARKQSQGDNQSEKSILNLAAGGVITAHEVSDNYPDHRDQDNLGGYEMDVF
ncbi:hypothetical protein FOPG_16881 [Fusarium oxysporum f. sp. conglutinans race 2 54008]|uniref:Rhodopsin domain-containing protein n=1 Tax=Fusarium oxysporum f. sp. conglutinans race 2 54008 TaxID=1089457 RepID=X0GUB4_FUSOX|nr:hypothetical protein FOPG_16881 [Fusarium oxysporum f. sp. conglutinans race 2 54008]KAI8411170.1 hypothetical protein FOFC_07764 [Fusarium oxysporum]